MPATTKYKLLGHPVTILLLGTALSYGVIPTITSRINRAKLLRENRLKIATNIIDDNMETNRRLNKIVTTLELFQKDNSGPAARFLNYRQEQKELRTTLNQRYLEFDSQAWWWYSQIYTEAQIVGIVSPQELNKIQDISTQYGNNLNRSVGVLSKEWNAFLRDTYRPTDPHNTELMKQTRKEMDKLQRERSSLIMQAAHIFADRR